MDILRKIIKEHSYIPFIAPVGFVLYLFVRGAWEGNFWVVIKSHYYAPLIAPVGFVLLYILVEKISRARSRHLR
jgi:hypothetical protein